MLQELEGQVKLLQDSEAKLESNLQATQAALEATEAQVRCS